MRGRACRRVRCLEGRGGKARCAAYVTYLLGVDLTVKLVHRPVVVHVDGHLNPANRAYRRIASTSQHPIRMDTEYGVEHMNIKHITRRARG